MYTLSKPSWKAPGSITGAFPTFLSRREWRRVSVTFLQRTLDDKQVDVSRDAEQKDDRNQARWQQDSYDWGQGAQV
jgi:hypothetical protein